jgi:hypothetical protein
MNRWSGFLVCGVITLAVLMGTAQAGNLARSLTVTGTDFAAFGDSGLRAVGAGELVVTGVTGTINEAYVLWHGPTNASDPDVNVVVTFAGTDVTGVNIGQSSDNCWAFSNSQAYRADVSALVTGDGTYAYSFPGFSAGSVETNGISLLIFYDDGVGGNNLDVAVFDGNDSNISNPFDDPGWNATLSDINYSSGTAEMFLIVSDGQVFSDPEDILINGTVLIPGGLNFQGDTLPSQGGCPDGNGCLWDHRTEDVTPFLSPGPNTLTLTTSGSASDCLSLIATVFIFPAGAIEPVEMAIPTIGRFGVVVMTVLLLAAGAFVLRRFSA